MKRTVLIELSCANYNCLGIPKIEKFTCYADKIHYSTLLGGLQVMKGIHLCYPRLEYLKDDGLVMVSPMYPRTLNDFPENSQYCLECRICLYYVNQCKK